MAIPLGMSALEWNRIRSRARWQRLRGQRRALGVCVDCETPAKKYRCLQCRLRMAAYAVERRARLAARRAA